jgi:hypothetical protein
LTILNSVVPTRSATTTTFGASNPCKYEDGKFTFGITYAIDGVGPLLNGEDTFTPAEQ